MDNNYLINLRKKGFQEFNSIEELIEISQQLFCELPVFPVLFGHESYPRDWTIKHMKPLFEKDVLTIKNYLCGLEEFSKKLFDSSTSDFSFNIVYEGVSHVDDFSQILFLSLSHKGVVDYNLELTLKSRSIYSAKSYLNRSFLEDVLEPYVGPNRK